MKQFFFSLFLGGGILMGVAFLFPGLARTVLAGDDICDDKMTEEECNTAKEKAKEEEEKKEKEEEAKKEAKELEEKIKKEQATLDDHQEVLGTITSQLNTTQYQVRAVTDAIETTELTIQRKEGEMESLEKRLLLQKAVLSGLVQNFYLTSQTSAVRTFAVDDGFVRMAQAKDNSVTLQERINGLIEDVYTTKDKITQEKAELEEVKEEKEDLLVLREQQAAQLAQQQSYQATKVASSEAKVRNLQSRLSSIRNILSGFLGESYSLDDVVEGVKDASKKTGVRKEFLFAMLDKETDLGRFTGGCYYKDSKMGSTNENYFKEITKSLGYDYKKVKVSCALSYGIGGAMGVAQFMPSTWMGYKDAIAKKTGNNPADPWNLEDGLMGMALYLKDKGGDKKSGEYEAAARYYCGGNWKRTVCYNYADTVTSWANGGYDEFF